MPDEKPPLFAVIGGSGVYDMAELENQRWVQIDSPFGDPSDDLLFGELDGETIVFLPRHGRGHRVSPTDINYRANIDCLKRVGVDRIISVSAVGSLREHLHPGDFVIVDQFIDRTFARTKSFFGEGLVAHVSMAHPVCAVLGDCLEKAAAGLSVKTERGGTYIVMEGPQFSTKAESEMYRFWGCDVIGMTNMPEAKLAREAEICYASVAMVTDYDCWHADHEHVTVDQVIRVLHENADHARQLIRNLAPCIKAHRGICGAGCQNALEYAIMTAPDKRDAGMMRRLEAVAGRVLKTEGDE